jgi:Na+/H+ antiporter NhaD/arsenite permease-like protein
LNAHTSLPTASAAPFALLLLAVAFLPLAAHHWWERNSSKALVSAFFAIPFATWLAFSQGAEGLELLRHSWLDYFSFIALLGSLFVIAGNIRLEGSFSGRPLGNAAFLAFGAVLSNLIGTTGASMVLVRPLLEANRLRKRTWHIFVFFIFVVSNCSGLLTPLGDPPLFLGFLKGVPFAWTMHLLPEWLFVNGLLLLMFTAVDRAVLRREDEARPEDLAEDVRRHRPLRVIGWHNAIFLAGVVATTLGRGSGFGTGGEVWSFGLQEGMLLALTAASFLTTPRAVRHANRFSFGPMIEVAVIFAGIFTTMVAPLLILNQRSDELGLSEPWEYFWATGLLSSLLDTAPTYLAFTAAASGDFGVSVDSSLYLRDLLAQGETAARVLGAISCGAVFMGANTYIGNGPNFMVKSIVEAGGVRMPSFVGYMAVAGVILLPVLAIATFVFFA